MIAVSRIRGGNFRKTSFLYQTQPYDLGTLAPADVSCSAPRFWLAMRRQGERRGVIAWRLCGGSDPWFSRRGMVQRWVRQSRHQLTPSAIFELLFQLLVQGTPHPAPVATSLLHWRILDVRPNNALQWNSPFADFPNHEFKCGGSKKRLNASFPSWSPWVRIPSPAPSFYSLGKIHPASCRSTRVSVTPVDGCSNICLKVGNSATGVYLRFARAVRSA